MPMIRSAMLPMSNSHLRLSNMRTLKRGEGCGIRGRGSAVALLDGGAGGQSSYRSIDDYMATTGINPLASSSGRGLERFGKSLEGLMIKPKGRKPKNINFSL